MYDRGCIVTVLKVSQGTCLEAHDSWGLYCVMKVPLLSLSFVGEMKGQKKHSPLYKYHYNLTHLNLNVYPMQNINDNIVILNISGSTWEHGQYT